MSLTFKSYFLSQTVLRMIKPFCRRVCLVFDEKYTVASIFIIKKANTFMIITQGGNKSNVQFHPIFAMWVIIQTAEIFSNSTIRRQK